MGRAVFLAAIMVISVVAMSAAFAGSAAAAEHPEIEGTPVSYEDAAGDSFVEIQFDEDPGWEDTGDVDGLEILNRNDGDVEIDSVDNEENVYTFGLNETLVVGATAASGDDDPVDVETTSATIYEGDETSTAFAGENVAILGDTPGQNVVIERPDQTVTRGLGDNSHVRTEDTSAYEGGDNITVTFDDGAGPSHTLMLEDLNLDAWTDADHYYDNQDVTVTGESPHLDIDPFDIIVYDDDGEEVDRAFDLEVDSEGQAHAQFQLEEGNYTAEFLHVGSGISAETDEFEVEQAPVVDEPIAFTQPNFNENVGDVAAISLMVEEGDSFFLTLEEDVASSPYEIELTVDGVEDNDEPVVVLFNTYAANDDLRGDTIVDVLNADDFTVEHETTYSSDFYLEPGTYDMEVYPEEGAVREDAAGLNLEERSLDDLTTHIAPGDRDLTDAGYIADNVSALDDVAMGDAVVFKVEASGIFGYLLDDGEFSGAEDLSLEVKSTDDPRFDDPAQIDLNESGVHIVEDAENNMFYLVLDTDEVVHEAENGNGEVAEAPGLDPEHEYEAIFTVGADNPYVDGDDDESVSDTFMTQERTLDLVGVEPIQVTMEGDYAWEIRGDQTYIAPGTMIDADISSNLLREDTELMVEADEDGERTFTIKFEDVDDSQVELGHEFSIDVDEEGTAEIDIEATGIVADEPEWQVIDEDAVILQELRDLLGVDDNEDLAGAISDLMTERDDLEAALEDANAEIDDLNDQIADLEGQISDLEQQLDDAMADDNGDGNGDDNGDDDGTPGFGVAVALVALLSAAMLALRRRD